MWFCWKFCFKGGIFYYWLFILNWRIFFFLKVEIYVFWYKFVVYELCKFGYKNVVECIDECIECLYIENKLIFLVWILVVLLGIWWDYVWNMMLIFFVYLGVCVVRDRSRNW